MTNIGIPTVYRGCRFRSRLEAKWAAFFDLMGWHWEYEPADCNGWIPDFALIGKEQITYVEVKPYYSLDEFVTNGVIEKAKKSMGKDKKEVLFVGVSLFDCRSFSDASIVGWLGEYDGGGEMWVDEACLNHFNEKYGFFHSLASYKDRITGLYDGDGMIETVPLHMAKDLFNAAATLTQWIPTTPQKTVVEKPQKKVDRLSQIEFYLIALADIDPTAKAEIVSATRPFADSVKYVFKLLSDSPEDGIPPLLEEHEKRLFDAIGKQTKEYLLENPQNIMAETTMALEELRSQIGLNEVKKIATELAAFENKDTLTNEESEQQDELLVRLAELRTARPV